jgi:hypothetical protein
MFTTVSFGMALGVTGIAFPLLALEAGFSPTVVGLLAATSATIQIVGRASIPALLGRITDRVVMIIAMVILLASASVLIFTAAAVGFIAAQILQGVARGLFWASSQTHAVRDPGVPTRRLASVHAAGQLGHMLGPAVAGLLAVISLRASLWAGVAVALLGAVFAVGLHRRPPYSRAPVSERTPIWRRPGVGMGAWGGTVSGVWRGILDSYVPVILTTSGFGPSAVGGLVTLADGSGLLTSVAVARWGNRKMGRLVPRAALGIAVALGLLSVGGSTLLILVALVLAGVSESVAAVLSAAAINESVEHSEQGAAIALSGVYRAGARSVAPALVGGSLLVVTMPVALGVLAATMLIPGIWLRPSPAVSPRANGDR